MSRRFAFALIAVVLVQFCGVFAWQKYERNIEVEGITRGAMVTNGLAITSVEELLNQQVMSYEELMTDARKARFVRLLHFVRTHHNGYQELVTEEHPATLRKRTIKFIEATTKAYRTLMLEDHKSIGFSKDDALIKCANTDAFTENVLTNLSLISPQLDPEIQNSMIRIIALDYVKNMLMDVMSACGGRALIFDQFFPVFNADRCAYRVGDSLNARLSVGSYSNALDPKNVVLTINGKQYPIGPDGTASFQTSERKRGQHTLETKVVVTNPLTGEVQVGEGSFTYEVY